MYMPPYVYNIMLFLQKASFFFVKYGILAFVIINTFQKEKGQ